LPCEAGVSDKVDRKQPASAGRRLVFYNARSGDSQSPGLKRRLEWNIQVADRGVLPALPATTSSAGHE
jgi:hypothetical protein